MPAAKTARLGYAQSSDIKSRTWEQYREDMKRKAIRELECLPLLQALLTERAGGRPVSAHKHGVDEVLWFDPKAHLSRQPDYRAVGPDGAVMMYEFKMSVKENLKFFDFKKTNVRRTRRPPHEPHEDREIFYVARAEGRNGFVSPKWVMDNGRIGPVPAWGYREAYRVPRDRFLPMLSDGGDRLRGVLRTIEEKEVLLDFQEGYLRDEKERLAGRLRRVVDEGDAFRVAPGTLSGFFETCLLMKHLSRFPEDPGSWLACLFSLIEDDATPEHLARAMYAVDGLYFRAIDVSEHGLGKDERHLMVDGLRRAARAIRAYPWSDGSREVTESQLEALRHMLFVVNLFEDLRQDVFYRWGRGEPPPEVRPARSIFESIPEVADVARRIRAAGVSES